MILSEILVNKTIHRVILEMYGRKSITESQKDFLIDGLFEGIKGDQKTVNDFLVNYTTSNPVIGQMYFPISVIFMIGFDNIEVKFGIDAIEYLGSKGGDYFYNKDGTEIKLPLHTATANLIIGTFNYDNYNDVKILRDMIQLQFGDCTITEHKI